MPDKPSDNVIVFDGVCVFCNAAVDFVLRHERSAKHYFVAMQSSYGQKLMTEHGIDLSEVDTFLLIDEGVSYQRSAAALQLAKHLRRPWCFAAVAMHLPRPIRDALYTAIARRRYRLFGQLDQCTMPPAEHRHRFLN